MKKMRWERLLQEEEEEEEEEEELDLEEWLGGSRPGKRSGHTCNAVRSGKFLYVFGGYGKHNCETDKVHVFDTAQLTWSQPTIEGQPPEPREKHTCTTVGDDLYIFGGHDGIDPLGDLHIFDTLSHSWIAQSVSGDGPGERHSHSAALFGSRLFVFGGCGRPLTTQQEVCYNDLYELNTKTFVWDHVVTSGNLPCARDSHTCSSWNNKMILIGGKDENDDPLSDVHILDAETLVWKELITTGTKFPPRAGHSTVALGKHLFVFGGFSNAENLHNDVYMLDVDSAIWTKVETAGDVPCARISASGDCLDPAEFGVLMFFGGCNNARETLDDVYYLHTGLSGIRGDEKRPKKPSSRKQLKLKRLKQILLENLEADHQSQFRQGNKTIIAEITETYSNGYHIEAVIDGTPLYGVLFPKKPACDSNNLDNTRKRASTEVGVVGSNGDCDSKPKVARTISEEGTGETNSDPSVTPSLNLNDDGCADVPALGEDPKERDKMAQDSNTLPAAEDAGTQVAAEVKTDPGTSARRGNMPPNCSLM